VIAAHELAEPFFVDSVRLSDDQRAWFRARGISDEAQEADPPIRFASVVFAEPFFDFATEDQGDATPAFVLIVRDSAGVSDIAAFDAQGRRFATWLGRAAMLGEQNVLGWRVGEPLLVCQDVWEWLRADRDGVVILDWPAAASRLEGHSLATETVEFGQILDKRLTRPPPPIFIKTGRAAA
jgi:hypothetical protein